MRADLTATIASSENSALSGSDFSALSQVISFADSSTASSSVQLTILGDAIIEADETLATVCCQCCRSRGLE